MVIRKHLMRAGVLSATRTIGKQSGNFSSRCKHSNDVRSSNRPDKGCKKLIQDCAIETIHKLTVLLVDEDDTKTGFCKVLAHNWVSNLLYHNLVKKISLRCVYLEYPNEGWLQGLVDI